MSTNPIGYRSSLHEDVATSLPQGTKARLEVFYRRLITDLSGPLLEAPSGVPLWLKYRAHLMAKSRWIAFRVVKHLLMELFAYAGTTLCLKQTVNRNQDMRMVYVTARTTVRGLFDWATKILQLLWRGSGGQDKEDGGCPGSQRTREGGLHVPADPARIYPAHRGRR